MFYALIYINNHVFSYLVSMLSEWMLLCASRRMGGRLDFVKSNMASITYITHSSGPKRDTKAKMAEIARILEHKGVMLIYRRLRHPSFPILMEMNLKLFENFFLSSCVMHTNLFAIYTCNYVIINANLGIKHFILIHVIIL